MSLSLEASDGARHLGDERRMSVAAITAITSGWHEGCILVFDNTNFRGIKYFSNFCCPVRNPAFEGSLS